MNTFADTIQDWKMINMLVSMRLKLASRRHNAHFFRSISPAAGDPARVTSKLDAVLPPRRTWARPGRLVRATLQSDELERRALLNAISKGMNPGHPPAPWAVALRGLLDDVRARAAAPRDKPLQVPAVTTTAKPRTRADTGTPVKYRALATYTELSDRLLLGMANKALSRAFDPVFMDSSHAFRATNDHSRNIAVKRIQDYVSSRQGKPVHVAECDIRNFYDSIDHDVIRAAFGRAKGLLEARGEPLPPQLSDIVEMYLESYDYFTVGEPAALADLQDKRTCGILSGPDCDELGALRHDGSAVRVGIPQGGPLSPLLANMVLDAVDRAVVGEGNDPDLLYIRYCDDMVILHTDEATCEAALKRYMARAGEMMFLVHPPSKLISYDHEFYDAKSKWPYRLADPATHTGASPWMNFLGYQVRYDGQMRIKLESLTKHKTKQKEVAMRIIRLANHPRARLLKRNEAILNTTAYRLVAAGVGKRGRTCPGTSVRCWMDAFPLLKRNEYAERQMRRLDQYRDGLLAKLGHVLNARHPGNREDMVPATGKGKLPKWKMPYLGRPLSYCGKLIGDLRVVPRRWRKENEGYGKEF